jgi:hypothetical protein
MKERTMTEFILKFPFRTFLGAFAKLRKAAIKFRHVRPPAWNNVVPTRQIFMKFGI